jgi:hypothetical protein
MVNMPMDILVGCFNSYRIGEKYLEWTDETPPLKDILASVSLYWLTDTCPRAIYPYREVSYAFLLYLLICFCTNYTIKDKLIYVLHTHLRYINIPIHYVATELRPQPYTSWYTQSLHQQAARVFFLSEGSVSSSCLLGGYKRQALLVKDPYQSMTVYLVKLECSTYSNVGRAFCCVGATESY